MTDDRFEEYLAEAAPAYNAPPPEPPREEMWARIQEARRFQRRPARRYPQWLIWGASIAAVLTIGITIGRLSLTQAVDPVPAERTAVDADAQRAALPYRLAAIQHMSQAEALITSYRADGPGSPDVRAWAEDLLSSTRLLLDSPAADDPNVRRLFEDLELILVQITQAPAQPGTQERELIDDALEQNNVLPRLRAAVPSGPVRVIS